MPLTNDFVSKVCKLGKGEETCSFLVNSGGEWLCAKNTPFEALLRNKRDAGLSKAKGDNCSGSP